MWLRAGQRRMPVLARRCIISMPGDMRGVARCRRRWLRVGWPPLHNAVNQHWSLGK